MTMILTRFNTLWQSRSEREKLLLCAMGGLFAVLLVRVAIVRPLAGFHARARDDYAASMQLYRVLEAEVETYLALREGDPATEQAGQSLRSLAGALALQHDLSLARMVPGEDGSLTVNVDRAQSTQLMRWLLALEERHGIQVSSSTIDREGDGIVSASVVLQRRGG